jgi:hypothetical protein
MPNVDGPIFSANQTVVAVSALARASALWRSASTAEFLARLGLEAGEQRNTDHGKPPEGSVSGDWLPRANDRVTKEKGLTVPAPRGRRDTAG